MEYRQNKIIEKLQKRGITEETDKNKMMTRMRKKRARFIQKQTTKSNL
jgi:hypothetical protein